MTVTIIIALSKMTGFVREMIMAAVFGRGVESDAYIAAYGILSIMTLLFSAGISSTFIPVYVRAQLRDGQNAADRYASNILTLYLLAGAVGSVLAYIFAPSLCALVFRAPQGLDLTIELTRLMYPTLAFYAMTGVLYNILNARERFIPEQLMGFVLSGLVIAACLLYREIHAVAVAVALVGCAQFLLMLPFLRGQFHYYPRLDFRDKRLTRTFLLAIPALVSLALGEINHQVDCAIGSSLGNGVITALNKSYALVATVLGVMVVPITTIMFSRLSKIAVDKSKKVFMDSVRASLETIMLVTLPIIVIAIFLRGDVIAVAYQRGAFTAADTAFTAPVFAFYIAGVMAFGIRNFLIRVFYAQQDTKTPMVIGIICVSINIGLDFLLAPIFGAVGIVIATTVSGLIGAAAQLWRIHRKMGHIGILGIIGQAMRMMGAIVVSFGVMIAISVLFGNPAATWPRLFKMVGCALAFLGVYIPMCLALHVQTMQTWFNRIRHRD